LANTDPFTEVYLKIIEVLFNDPDVVDVVRPGNFIKRASEQVDGLDFRRPKEDKLDGDLSEIDVIPAGGLVDLPNTSTGVVIQQNFEIITASATARLDINYFPLFFAIIRAFSRVGCQLGIPELVERIQLTNYTDDENLAEVLKGLEGWSSLLSVIVKMRIDRTALL